MPVKIRLARRGRKKAPVYDVVVADARAPRDGRYIEKIGTYNPNVNPAAIDIDNDKAFHWVMTGAQPTDTVRAMLSYRGIMLKKHLQIGVIKGAITQEEADARFEEWAKAKESHIQGKIEAHRKTKYADKKARLEAERKVKEARAARIAVKYKEEIEDEGKTVAEYDQRDFTQQSIFEEEQLSVNERAKNSQGMLDSLPKYTPSGSELIDSGISGEKPITDVANAVILPKELHKPYVFTAQQIDHPFTINSSLLPIDSTRELKVGDKLYYQFKVEITSKTGESDFIDDLRFYVSSTDVGCTTEQLEKLLFNNNLASTKIGILPLRSGDLEFKIGFMKDFQIIHTTEYKIRGVV